MEGGIMALRALDATNRPRSDIMTITRMDSPTDPDRCQGVVPSRGQCTNKRTTPSEYCMVHGANKGIAKSEKESISAYRVAVWDERLRRQTTHPGIKGLRDEIGILRMIMEETLNRCENPFDLLAQSQKISDLAIKITMVVEKCHRLEGSMGQLLDKKTIIQMANTFIQIISEEDLPEESLDRIAAKILQSVADDQS